MTRLFMRTIAGLVVLCLLAAPVVLAKKTKVPDDLPERYKVWLDEVRLLITKEERETFLTIAKDYQRDAFIDRFWKIRDPYPGSGPMMSGSVIGTIRISFPVSLSSFSITRFFLLASSLIAVTTFTSTTPSCRS